MRALGYRELNLEVRAAEGRRERLPALAAERRSDGRRPARSPEEARNRDGARPRRHVDGRVLLAPFELGSGRAGFLDPGPDAATSDAKVASVGLAGSAPAPRPLGHTEHGAHGARQEQISTVLSLRVFRGPLFQAPRTSPIVTAEQAAAPPPLRRGKRAAGGRLAAVAPSPINHQSRNAMPENAPRADRAGLSHGPAGRRSALTDEKTFQRWSCPWTTTHSLKFPEGSFQLTTITTLSCRRCGRSAAETGTHWDAECGYNVTEARAGFSARRVSQEGSLAPPHWGRGTPAPWRKRDPINAVAISSPSGGLANKTSRRGRPRTDPTSKRANAAALQRAYRRRHSDGPPAVRLRANGTPRRPRSLL